MQSSEQREKSELTDFLTSSSTDITGEFNYEDALPSTLSRKTALEAQAKIAAASPIAAAYYPDWVVDSWPPEKLDFSKFDILFFGMQGIWFICFVTSDNQSLISLCYAELLERHLLGLRFNLYFETPGD